VYSAVGASYYSPSCRQAIRRLFIFSRVNLHSYNYVSFVLVACVHCYIYKTSLVAVLLFVITSYGDSRSAFIIPRYEKLRLRGRTDYLQHIFGLCRYSSGLTWTKEG